MTPRIKNCPHRRARNLLKLSANAASAEGRHLPPVAELVRNFFVKSAF
jgi:hypothetical protein